MNQKPTVGRIVHYVSHGTPVREDGTQAYTSQCRAAIITDVPADDACALAVFNPTGMFFNRALYDGSENPAGGTWHWPEQETPTFAMGGVISAAELRAAIQRELGSNRLGRHG